MEGGSNEAADAIVLQGTTPEKIEAWVMKGWGWGLGVGDERRVQILSS